MLRYGLCAENDASCVHAIIGVLSTQRFVPLAPVQANRKLNLGLAGASEVQAGHPQPEEPPGEPEAPQAAQDYDALPEEEHPDAVGAALVAACVSETPVERRTLWHCHVVQPSAENTVDFTSGSARETEYLTAQYKFQKDRELAREALRDTRANQAVSPPPPCVRTYLQ